MHYVLINCISYVIGSNNIPELLYEEKDEMFRLSVGKTKTKDWIFLKVQIVPILQNISL